MDHPPFGIGRDQSHRDCVTRVDGMRRDAGNHGLVAQLHPRAPFVDIGALLLSLRDQIRK